jgi:hypothetical protein
MRGFDLRNIEIKYRLNHGAIFLVSYGTYAGERRGYKMDQNQTYIEFLGE